MALPWIKTRHRKFHILGFFAEQITFGFLRKSRTNLFSWLYRIQPRWTIANLLRIGVHYFDPLGEDPKYLGPFFRHQKISAPDTQQIRYVPPKAGSDKARE